MMECVFASKAVITAIHGVPHGDYLERNDYAVGTESVVEITPCAMAGNGGYMTWFRIVYEDGSDVIVSPHDIAEVIRNREPK
jgi:hypothetical protein